jgi:hypothetical protein
MDGRRAGREPRQVLLEFFQDGPDPRETGRIDPEPLDGIGPEVEEGAGGPDPGVFPASNVIAQTSSARTS